MARSGWVWGAATFAGVGLLVALLLASAPEDADARITYTIASGATLAVLLACAGLWAVVRRKPGRRWFCRGRPSRAAWVAAFGSAVVALTVVAVLGVVVASVTLPLPYTGANHARAVVGNHVFAPAILVLFVVPWLLVVALLFAQAAEHPPRGLGALPVGVAHGMVAAFVAGLGLLAPSTRATVLCLALAAPPAAAAVAYVVLFVDAVRLPMSRRP